MTSSLNELTYNKMFGGWQKRYEHFSPTLDCNMNVSVFLPEAAGERPLPALYWLSGLTCNDENFVIKAGAQRMAAELGVILIAPDTSPRGPGVPDDPDGSWDFGLGAGFYLNATQDPWRSHYQMEDYIVKELPELLTQTLPIDPDRQSLFGHSMGGHGALTLAIKNPHQFRSVSAFAPICSPTRCPWGEKAFSYYLGDNRKEWEQYDTCLLLDQRGFDKPILVDQGLADSFLAEQLKPELLEQACEKAGVTLRLNRREGYDHSYFFIASFIEEHLRFHAEALTSGT